MVGLWQIMHQPKLLIAERALLAILLREQAAWDAGEVPDDLTMHIATVRARIQQGKQLLGRWKLPAIDHPDDAGAGEQFARDVAYQRALLRLHRANLGIYFLQLRRIPPDLLPPMMLQAMQEERASIDRIKAILRGWQVAVADVPLDAGNDRGAPEALALPSPQEIAQHQKLLKLYRVVLAEYLRQYSQWSCFSRPRYLATELDAVRRHIMDAKGTLGSWGVPTDDHPDDDWPPGQVVQEIVHQRQLLQIHRANLASCAKRRQQYGAGFVPLVLFHELHSNYASIQRIKAILRGWQVAVDDLPADAVPPL